MSNESRPRPAEPAVESPKYQRHAFSLFLVTLALHAVLVFYNWRQGFLPGHEFRQTQTALSIAFIEKDHDYSLAYPTPLFGPPWSVPMEFPLYQWSAAWIGQTTGWSVPVSARTVSLICFYLCLPAFGLLLKDCGFGAAARWSALSLVLCTPIYIFYTRAVLIESMALMFTLWFVLAFSRMCRQRSWSWLAVATVAATAASLVKVTSMMAWCIGPAIGGLWWSWQEWRRGSWPAWRNSVLMGVGCAIPPGIASIWWVQTADAIKANSPGGKGLISSNLTDFNFGAWSDRLELDKLAQILHNVSTGIAPLWVVVTTGILGLLAGKYFQNWRGPIALGWFGAVVFAFPVLYRIHDYYFYAIAMLTIVSVISGIEFAVRRFNLPWIRVWLILFVALTQLHAYKLNYWPGHSLPSNGGSQMHRLIHDATPADGVIIVLGEDWSSSTAYYSRRRCFMIREHMLHFPDESLEEMEGLKDVRISALLTNGMRRDSHYMIDRITARFDLDPKPTASNPSEDLYVSKRLRREFLKHLAIYPNYGDTQSIERPPTPIPEIRDEITADLEIHPVTANQAATRFVSFSPSPFQYRAQFGFSSEFINGKFAAGAHPDCDLWVKVPVDAEELEISFGLRDETYEDPTSATDGVEFSVTAIAADGTESPLFQRLLDPNHQDADRGEIFHQLTLPSPRPATLRFSARPGPNANYAFDWAYWGDVEIH